jgi:acetylcholinesterase
MGLGKSLSALACLCALPFTATANSPVVDLGYSIYEGTTQSNGQNQFLGIRFAAPPLGGLRFRAPEPPLPTKGTQPAKAFGPICFGLGAGITSGSSEDCLFLNVWAPADATPESKLPVFFWISGGGYIALSNANVSSRLCAIFFN